MENMKAGKHKPRTQQVTPAPGDARTSVNVLVTVQTQNSPRDGEREATPDKAMSGGTTVHTQQLHSSPRYRKQSSRDPSHTLRRLHSAFRKKQRNG